jgi:hypothetical protein
LRGARRHRRAGRRTPHTETHGRTENESKRGRQPAGEPLVARPAASPARDTREPPGADNCQNGDAGRGRQLGGEAKPNSQGGELNDFIRQLVDRREQRRHQLEIIQDFFENPVEFGIEADVIPSGTPLEEIRERKKELRYRIDLLRSVLEALEGEHKLLTHAEMSALRPQSDPVE